MPRASSIAKLPNEIREKIAVLRNQGRTIDEILDHLETIDVDVSRSSLGRYFKKQQKVLESIKRSRLLAEAVAREFGDQEGTKIQRTNIELLHGLVTQLMLGGENDEDVVLDPKNAMFVATALEKLSKASKLSVDEELQIRKEAEREAMKKAASMVDEAAKEAKDKGLSPEMVDQLKAKFLGVKAT